MVFVKTLENLTLRRTHGKFTRSGAREKFLTVLEVEDLIGFEIADRQQPATISDHFRRRPHKTRPAAAKNL